MTADPFSARPLRERLAAVATAVAAAYVVVAIAVLPFLTPAWISFEQGRTHAASLVGYSDAELSTATNAILHDLVIGPPDFAVEVAGAPVLEERERAHMRDVRGVFGGFFLLGAAAAIVLIALVAGARRSGHMDRAWAAVGAGMRWLIVGIVVAGVIASVAFDAVFEIFHRLFFPAGSFDFDPRTDHLVQLFPFDFWSETTIVLGVVIVAIAAVLALVASRRSRGSEVRADAADGREASAAPRPEIAR